MAYFIKSAVICFGLLLLLLAAHSSGNPLPARDPRSPDSRCHHWQLDTNSEIESITQVSNGITVFNRITPYQGLLNGLVCTNACTSEFIPSTIILLSRVHPFIL